MVKKVLTFALGLMVALGATAQMGPGNPTVPQSAIQFWTGTGSNRAVIAVTWEDASEDMIGVAWGVQWNGGPIMLKSLMDTIAAYDSRFTMTYTSWVSNLAYNDPELGLDLLGEADLWWYNWLNSSDVSYSSLGVTTDMVHDGDFVDWMQMGTADTMIMASDPNASGAPVEATIAQSDILYWVGEGANSAVLAVNWADTALAWGYRWDGSATVESMMAAIADADPRFSYSGSGWMNDIMFDDGTVSLAGTPGNYWGSTNNGVMDMGMTQTLADGDFEKWGDPAAGTVVDSMEYGGVYYYTYVYTMAVHPVSVPYVPGPFCGPVGTEGCDAVAADSSAIVAWATGCTVVRGRQDIAVADSPLASFGSDSNALGVATTATTDAVSLGDGGVATLTFARPIANGDGPDFAVFENAIRSIVTGGYFLELAFVEVSTDGERFVRFPATSLTPADVQVGTYGEIDPTYINNLAGKYEVGYGTPFDLAELADSTGIDIDSINYVRIVDVVGSIDPQYASHDAFGHIVNDPYPTAFASCGFDLTGVAVMHQRSVGIADVEEARVALWPNPTTDRLRIAGAEGRQAALFDAMGRRVMDFTVDAADYTLDLNALAAGVYILRIGSVCHKVVKH